MVEAGVRIRLTILSRSASIASTARLLEAARARGMRARVLSPLDCAMHVDGKDSHLIHRGRPVPPADVVIPRIAPSVAPYGLAVVNHFDLRGAVILNEAEAIARSRNRMRALQLLSSHGIGVPRTVMGRDAKRIQEMIPLVGGVPVLVKLLQGDRQGVMVCETLHSLEAALEALLGLGQNLVVQQYVRGKGERDIRALVVGGRVLCALRRIPQAGRLSRTLGRGARYEAIELPPAYKRSVIRATELIGLEVAAVDLLDQKDGPKIFEVNSSPGLATLEAATGLDLAGAIVEHAAARVRERGAEAPSRGKKRAGNDA